MSEFQVIVPGPQYNFNFRAEEIGRPQPAEPVAGPSEETPIVSEDTEAVIVYLKDVRWFGRIVIQDREYDPGYITQEGLEGLFPDIYLDYLAELRTVTTNEERDEIEQEIQLVFKIKTYQSQLQEIIDTGRTSEAGQEKINTFCEQNNVTEEYCNELLDLLEDMQEAVEDIFNEIYNNIEEQYQEIRTINNENVQVVTHSNITNFPLTSE
ncbi:hypothetical protein ACFL56_01505 [Candidatus Margulisiibacteriota bacterium]